MADDLFNEWSAGVSLANPTNDFFEELPMELNKPAEFVVAPEQLPANPLEVPVPEIVPQEEPVIVGPEVRTSKTGGTVTLEKTSRGWRAVLDTGDSTKPPENFYANNKDELIFAIAEGKLEATKAIHKLKKEKLLGGAEPAPATPIHNTRNIPKASVLTADDVVEIRTKLADNPSDALDSWIEKRFGLKPEELAEALKSAPEARRIVEAQQVKADVDEVNAEFVKANPDYAEDYSTPENARILIGRMAKAYLNKKITSKTPQAIVDDCIYELYTKGYWTVENLSTAKEELLEGELLEPIESHPSTPQPQPQPVTTPSGPSVTAAPRIAAPPGQPVGLVGLPARSSAPSQVPDDKPLTDVDLQNMPLSELRNIAAAQLRAQQQGRQ